MSKDFHENICTVRAKRLEQSILTASFESSLLGYQDARRVRTTDPGCFHRKPTQLCQEVGGPVCLAPLCLGPGGARLEAVAKNICGHALIKLFV